LVLGYLGRVDVRQHGKPDDAVACHRGGIGDEKYIRQGRQYASQTRHKANEWADSNNQSMLSKHHQQDGGHNGQGKGKKRDKYKSTAAIRTFPDRFDAANLVE
jgi:hypothetical protein